MSSSKTTPPEGADQPASESWWGALEDFRNEVNTRFDEGDARMGRIEAGLKENTAETAEVKRDTGELLELLKSWKGAFKVLDGLGKIAKPLGYIAFFIGAVVGAVMAIKGGK